MSHLKDTHLDIYQDITDMSGSISWGKTSLMHLLAKQLWGTFVYRLQEHRAKISHSKTDVETQVTMNI